MNDDNMPPLFIFIVNVAMFIGGYVCGFSMGEQFSQHETINFCVEKPVDCKTKYDYFKLEEQK